MAGRKPKIPPSPFNGITLDQWQLSEPYVAWARTDPMFSIALSVVQNGMLGVSPDQFSGYRAAFNQLLALRLPAPNPQKNVTPTYREPISEMDIAHEQSGD